MRFLVVVICFSIEEIMRWWGEGEAETGSTYFVGDDIYTRWIGLDTKLVIILRICTSPEPEPGSWHMARECRIGESSWGQSYLVICRCGVTGEKRRESLRVPKRFLLIQSIQIELSNAGGKSGYHCSQSYYLAQEGIEFQIICLHSFNMSLDDRVVIVKCLCHAWKAQIQYEFDSIEGQ